MSEWPKNGLLRLGRYYIAWQLTESDRLAVFVTAKPGNDDLDVDDLNVYGPPKDPTTTESARAGGSE